MTRNGMCSLCTHHKAKYIGSFQKLARQIGGLRFKIKRVYCCNFCWKVLEDIWNNTFAIRQNIDEKVIINLLDKKFSNGRWIYANFVLDHMKEKRSVLNVQVS